MSSPPLTLRLQAGSNGWDANHDALNGGLNNHWAIGNTPWFVTYHCRQLVLLANPDHVQVVGVLRA